MAGSALVPLLLSALARPQVAWDPARNLNFLDWKERKKDRNNKHSNKTSADFYVPSPPYLCYTEPPPPSSVTIWECWVMMICILANKNVDDRPGKYQSLEVSQYVLIKYQDIGPFTSMGWFVIIITSGRRGLIQFCHIFTQFWKDDRLVCHRIIIDQYDCVHCPPVIHSDKDQL